MSAIYDRVIAISRPANQTGVGAIGYGGATQGTLQQIASGIAASIQLVKSKAVNPAGLPGDVPTTEWRIFFRSTDLSLLSERYVISDDLGRRFEVLGAYPNVFGFSALCKLLEL
ncbi:hypothetical protein [Paraburkholderia kururiensis]|uniref:hypothetical protein n=1 Tax=Paraburkholderia kururiensis TaxID=984307 RepID=UPI0005A986C6|nr:hypothetical protein [Paraburkholderia kururiensis]